MGNMIFAFGNYHLVVDSRYMIKRDISRCKPVGVWNEERTPRMFQEYNQSKGTSARARPKTNVECRTCSKCHFIQ